MNKFTIHTELTNEAMEVCRTMQGLTVVPCIGMYKGQSEDSIMIIYLGKPEEFSKVVKLAEQIKEKSKQEEVWITVEPVTLVKI